MTIFRRKLTFLTALGMMMIAAAGAIFAFDFHTESRQHDMLAFLTSAVAVRKGGDFAKLEGKIVYAVGRPEPTRTLSDPDLGLTFQAISISRDSEIYQWTQRCSKHPKYRTEWVEAPVDTRTFRRPDGHQNKGVLEFAAYGDAADDVLVNGVPVDPSFVAGVRSRLIPLTQEMYSQLPESVRSRYVLDHGRLVEHAPVASGKSDPARVGTNRVSFRAAIPREGIVVGFMHDGRIIPGETDLLGRVGAYVPGASDLRETITGVEESDDQSHMLRLISAVAMAVLAGGVMFRDFSTAQIVQRPLRFGR